MPTIHKYLLLVFCACAFAHDVECARSHLCYVYTVYITMYNGSLTAIQVNMQKNFCRYNKKEKNVQCRLTSPIFLQRANNICSVFDNTFFKWSQLLSVFLILGLGATHTFYFDDEKQQKHTHLTKYAGRYEYQYVFSLHHIRVVRIRYIYIFN